MKRAQRIHLGTWTIFCDIAGWVQESPDNPIVTIAAVAMPPERVKKRRVELLKAFDGEPAKWKKGGLVGWERAVNVILRPDVHVGVSQIHRVGPAWGQFYAQAKDVLEIAKRRLEGKAAFLAPDNVMRMLLLSKGFAGLSGRMLSARHPWGPRPATIRMEIVADSDLKGEEAENLFRRGLEEWPSVSELSKVLNVEQTVRARVADDEAEPLLLLPDYVAGIYHHADPRTRLARAVADPQDAALAVNRLRERMGVGQRLHEMPEEFDETYPLDHDDFGAVRVRD